ncbi:MAG: CHAT domain-containing protein, partial [Bacteroidota bacterium]
MLAAQLIDTLRLRYVHNDSKFKLAEAALTVYEGAIEAAYRLYQQTSDPQLFAKAFAMSEKSKAVLLLQSLKDVNARQFAQIPDSLSQQERAIASQITRLEEQLFKARFNSAERDSLQIAEWENQLFALHREREQLAQELELIFPDYHRLKYDLQAHGIEELQQALSEENRALVEYFVGERNLAILYLDQDHFRWQIQPLPSNLPEQVQQFRGALASPLATEEAEVLLENGLSLYYELIQPLYDLGVDTSKSWLMVPDGVLGYLPFEALMRSRPAQVGAYKTYDFLLFAQRLSYTYSAEIWLEMRQKKSTASKTLIAFAPTFGPGDNPNRGFDPLRGGFSPLAHNQEEAEAVQATMGGRVLLGSEATELAFRQLAGQYQIIHLSSHARVNDTDPLYSQIAFSHTEKAEQDGLITVAELFEMHLPVEMIVLSACETGVGKLYRGEGISSQAKGFAYAGAKSIITTLWSINDAASSILMPDLYEGLQAGMSKDEALREAKLRYIQQSDQLGAHPFYWAAFVPIGDMA